MIFTRLFQNVEILQSPSNGNTSLWLNELVALGQRAGQRDEERDTGDDSMETSRNRVTQHMTHNTLDCAHSALHYP